MRKFLISFLILCLLCSFCVFSSSASSSSSSSSSSLVFSTSFTSRTVKYSDFSSIRGSATSSPVYYCDNSAVNIVFRSSFSLSSPSRVSIPYSDAPFATASFSLTPSSSFSWGTSKDISWTLLSDHLEFSYKVPSSSFIPIVYTIPASSNLAMPDISSSLIFVDLPAGDISVSFTLSTYINSNVPISSPISSIPSATLKLTSPSSFSVPINITPLSSGGGSSSGGSSSGGSYPSSPSIVYTPGTPQTLTSSLSRQSFNYGIDRSGDFVTPVLADTDYFQYPNVADHILGPMTVGSTSSVPLLGSQEPCYIRQYFDVRIPEGYYKFDWSLPSPPIISFKGDVVAYASSYPGVTAGSVSGSFYSGGVGSVVAPSGISQVDGYYYVPNTGIYTFYCDFNYTSSWPAYVLSGDLTSVAPNPPQLIATPYYKSTDVTPGSEIPLPSAPSDTSDTSSKANTDAILSYLGSLYVQYLKDSSDSIITYIPQYGANGKIYPASYYSAYNQSVASQLFLINNQNCSWWSAELNFLDTLTQLVPTISQIRSQLDGSLSPVVSLLQAVQSQLHGSLSSAVSSLQSLQSQFYDFTHVQTSSGVLDLNQIIRLINTNTSHIYDDVSALDTNFSNYSDQAHSDMLTLLSAIEKLHGGDDTLRPWEQFEDDYIDNEKSSIDTTKDAIDNSNALGSLSDISGGVSSGDYGSSSLGAAEDAVTAGDMYSLWSHTTNDAFNGDVDDWYSDDAVKGRLSW